MSSFTCLDILLNIYHQQIEYFRILQGLANGVAHDKNGNKRPHDDERLILLLYVLKIQSLSLFLIKFSDFTHEHITSLCNFCKIAHVRAMRCVFLTTIVALYFVIAIGYSLVACLFNFKTYIISLFVSYLKFFDLSAIAHIFFCFPSYL